jgi:CO/xanthine dehydrogenase FAD-binding subunit
LALGADVVLSSASGVERHPIAQMITGGVPEGCLITAVNVPHVPGRRSGFRKFAWRQSSGKTLVSVAGALRLQEGHIVQPRLAVGGLCRHSTRLLEAEEALTGQHWSEDLVAEIARLAAAQAVCDVEGPPSADYRRRLVAAGVRHVLATIATS